MSKYVCPRCGNELVFFDDMEDVLVCEKCGYDIDIDEYGLTEDEIADMYPGPEEFEEYEPDEDYDGEYYDPEFDE